MCEFLKLQETVRGNVAASSTNAKFEEVNSNIFVVSRFNSSIRFQFKQNKDAIEVAHSSTGIMFAVTPTLNNDGECRYRINGEGEYLRWQVAQKALEKFLFGPVEE